MRLNGLEFNLEIDGDGHPLLVLHGYTGSLRAWDSVRPAMTRFARCIWVDAIGHGGSAAPPDSERYSLDWSTRDLSALLDALDLEAVDLLGYSMGGRAALHFAVHAPDRVRRLILESASPGIDDAAERRRRAASDAALADHLLRVGIEAFVEEWERLPLLQLAPHVAAAAHTAQHALRLQNSPLGLANSLRGMGTGHQASLWSHLPRLDRRVLLIVGENDARYRDIAVKMSALLPSSETVVVPDAGHTVHVDQPARFVRLVEGATN